MIRSLAGLALITASAAAPAANASSPTDFGERVVSGAKLVTPIVREGGEALTPLGGSGGIAAAARIGARWGRVTSTYRTPAHNRAVGGVPNSYHLSGRAIDIARRPGVRHGDIAAAYRAAGYALVESLDEGDHSHFAFAFGAPVRAVQPAGAGDGTQWRMVYAPGAGGR